MKKTLEWLTEDIKKDIKKASGREISSLYSALKNALKKYDDDPLLKNICDFFKRGIVFDKRERCFVVLDDLLEELKKPGFARKDELRGDLLVISNIHRDFLENLIALLENL